MAALAAAVLMAAGGCGTAAVAPRAVPPAVHGAGQAAAGFSAPTPGAASRVAALTGVRPVFLSTYAGAGSAWPSAWADLAAQDGATLIVQIDTGGIPMSRVAAGGADWWLRPFAEDAARWGGKLAIGIDHEFNGPWWPWSYEHQPASSFTAGWRHIVTLFRSKGVHASWVWTISNVTGPQAGPLAPYWPGRRYVTWIGVNAYYYKASDTFASAFAPAITEARKLAGKPVLIAETGANPRAGQVRAIRDLSAGIAAASGVLGFVWFDYDKRSAHGPDHNWLIDNSPAAVAAFAAAAGGRR